MRFLYSSLFLLILLVSCQTKGTDSKQSKKGDQQMEQEQNKSDKEALTSTKPKADGNPATSIAHYICYTDDTKKDRRIWIAFTEESKAVKIKYQGQTQSIDLDFKKQDFKKGDAYPTTIDYYDEIYEGKKNGEYKLTHSGNWDYVAYTRGKDGKVFNFTIDHNADPYGKQPCF